MHMHLYTHTRTHTRHTRGDILCFIVWNSVAITCLRRAPCPPFLPLFESRAMRSVFQGPTQSCRRRGEERKRERKRAVGERRFPLSFSSLPFLSFPFPLLFPSLSLSLSLSRILWIQQRRRSLCILHYYLSLSHSMQCCYRRWKRTVSSTSRFFPSSISILFRSSPQRLSDTHTHT